MKLICPITNCSLIDECEHSKSHEPNDICFCISSCPDCVNVNKMRKEKLKKLKYETQENHQEN